MKKVDTANIQEAGEFRQLPAGAYICTIISAEDVPEKEYLRITYDIAKGEFANFYGETRERHPDWNVGIFYRSYKTKALPMFKRFCSAVSKSNGKFVFDGGTVNADEKTLAGKLVGLVLQEEEYYGNDGNKKTRLTVAREFAIGDLDKQKVPEPKRIRETKDVNDFVPTVSSEEIPW